MPENGGGEYVRGTAAVSVLLLLVPIYLAIGA